MWQQHGLGLRGQLIIALVVVFGIAFVMLSLVSARLEIARQSMEETTQAVAVADVLNQTFEEEGEIGVRRLGLRLVEHGAVHRVELQSSGKSVWSEGVASGQSHANIELGDDRVLLVWSAPVTRDVRRTTSLFLLYLGLTALAVLLLAYLLLTYLIVRPVDAMTRASETLALGRLDKEVPVRGAAEVARLSVAFNDMAAQLRQDRLVLQQRLQELEQKTEELTAAQDQVIRADRLAAVGRLSAGVAHEIGNPLAAIQGLLDLSQDTDMPPADRIEYLKRIRAETDRIHNTIRDLLDFSRNDSSERAGSCDLRAAVDSTIKLIEHQKRFNGVKIETELPAGLPDVRGSQDRLRQLLLNLFFNAADALDGKGTIRVVASPADDFVSLKMIDDGPGIAPEVIDQVFDPFVTTKGVGQGTGLGLSISYTIVDRLGGSIHASNNATGGACFEVRLPQANA